MIAQDTSASIVYVWKDYYNEAFILGNIEVNIQNINLILTV